MRRAMADWTVVASDAAANMAKHAVRAIDENPALSDEAKERSMKALLERAESRLTNLIFLMMSNDNDAEAGILFTELYIRAIRRRLDERFGANDHGAKDRGPQPG